MSLTALQALLSSHDCSHDLGGELSRHTLAAGQLAGGWCKVLTVQCCLQMEKRAAQAGQGGVQSKVQLLRASPQRAALRLAEEHVALEPASMSIHFKPLSRSQAVLRRG